MTREDRIRDLERMAEATRPGLDGLSSPLARSLGTIAATLLDHERRLPPEAPAVATPQYTPAELVAIAAEEGREGAGPVLYPDAARPIEFVAALMACGITVEVDPENRTVTALGFGARRAFTWLEIAESAAPLHRLAAEVHRTFRDGGAK